MTVYIEYKDGKVLSRKGESALFESGKGRNYIKNLGVLKKADFKEVTDTYSLYTLGFDVKVGDITINKATHGAAIYTEITEANTDLTSTLKKGGIQFMSASEGASFTISGYVDTGNDLIIINSNEGAKINYTHPSDRYFNHNNKIFAMKGIEVSLGSKYLINNSKAADNSGKIIFDDCKFINVGTAIYYGSVKTMGMSLIQFNKCDIVTTGALQLVNLNTTTVMNDYKNIKFYDCTLSSGSQNNFVLVNSATAAQTGDNPTSLIEVKNCTFHNLRPNTSYINVPWCGNIKFNKNLVSVYSLTQNGTMVNTNTDSNGKSSIDVSDNYYYVNNFNSKTLKTVPSAAESVTSESSYPFNTNTFQVKAAYAGYGANR